jgi:hypothetical protein
MIVFELMIERSDGGNLKNSGPNAGSHLNAMALRTASTLLLPSVPCTSARAQSKHTK